MNKETTDTVFERMTYSHGWTTTETVELEGRSYQLRIFCTAYSGQGVTDHQRQAFHSFCENKDKVFRRGLLELRDYYRKNYAEIKEYLPDRSSEYAPENLTDNTLLYLVKPKTLLFNRDGVYAILCDCAWDPEHGLAIIISGDGITVGPEDDIL